MPLFLWLVGFSIVISLRRLAQQGVPLRTQITKILQRTGKLVLIGLLVSGGGLPHGQCHDGDGSTAASGPGAAGIPGGYNLAELRVMGILQRIAVCYLITSLTTLASQRVVEARVVRMEQEAETSWSYDKQVKWSLL